MGPIIHQYLSFGLGGVLLLGLLAAGFICWKKRKNKLLDTNNSLSPDVKAFRRLQALIGNSGGGKDFYFQLSAILREYFHGRFGIDALEMPTEELLIGVEKLKIDIKLKTAIKSFLASSDPVITKSPWDKKKMQKDLFLVITFVRETSTPERVR